MFRRPLVVHWLSLGVIAGISLAIAAFIAWNLTVQNRSVLITEAIERSYLSSKSFAEASESWILAGADETLQRVVDLMLIGGSVYVEIVIDARSIFQKPAPSELDPSVSEALFPSGKPRPGGRLHTHSNGLLIDSTIPISPGTDSDAAEGFQHYVRVCTDAEFLAVHLRQSSTQILGTVTGGYGVVVLAISLMLGALHRAGHIRLPWKSEDLVDAAEEHRIRQGCLLIDTAIRTVMLHEEGIDLPPKPYELLLMLAEEDGAAVSEQVLLETLWRDSPYADSNDIRQCIYQLRRRLDAAQPRAGRCIANVRGFGYRFDVEKLASPSNGTAGQEETHDAKTSLGGRNA